MHSKRIVSQINGVGEERQVKNETELLYSKDGMKFKEF